MFCVSPSIVNWARWSTGNDKSRYHSNPLYCHDNAESEQSDVESMKSVAMRLEESDMVSITKLSSGQKLVTVGTALALLCFFLPWLHLGTSLGDQFICSGWQLMAGSTVHINGYTVQLNGSASLFLILLSGLAVFGFMYNAIRIETLAKVDSWIFIWLGILPLLVLVYWFGTYEYINIQFGVLGVAIGYGVVIIGGVLDRKARPVL
jgi:hypothetical protein